MIEVIRTVAKLLSQEEMIETVYTKVILNIILLIKRHYGMMMEILSV